MRVRLLLKKRYPHLSQKKIDALLKDGHVRVNGKVVRPAADVSESDALEVQADLSQDTLLPNSEVDCRVLKITPDFIFFEKGSGVHSVAHDFDERDTAANWLLSVDAGLASVDDPLESGLAHRLDQETSGVMVAARSAEVLSRLKQAFASHDVEKEYVCLVSCRPRETGVCVAYAGKHPRSAKRVRVVPRKGAGVSRIETEILRVEPQGDLFRVRVRLITGYRHQIRAHLGFLGCAILGDDVYGGDSADRLMLHAERIVVDGLEVKSKVPF